jgi:hypothetical protein
MLFDNYWHRFMCLSNGVKDGDEKVKQRVTRNKMMQCECKRVQFSYLS